MEALTLALRLTVKAPIDERAGLVLDQAEILTSRMTLEEVNQAKAAAEKRTGPPDGLGQHDHQ